MKDVLKHGPVVTLTAGSSTQPGVGAMLMFLSAF
jgi:hypothetical protein